MLNKVRFHWSFMGKINESVTVSFWFIPAKFEDTILCLLEALWVCPATLLHITAIIFACTFYLSPMD